MSFYPRLWAIFGPLAWLATAQVQPDNRASAPKVSPAPASEPKVSVEAFVAEAARQRDAGARGLLNPSLQVVSRILGDRTAADTEIIASQPPDLFVQRRAQAGVLAAQTRSAHAASLLSAVVNPSKAAAPPETAAPGTVP